MDSFYDKEEDLFKITPNTKLAHLLGEEVDTPNPSETFHKVENICDERIKKLSEMLFNLKKKGGNNSDEMEILSKNIADNFDDIEKILYYRIRDMFSDFERKNNDLNAKNLLLQKHLTKLTKEKMDILIQINLLVQKLDKIEQFLGINIESKKNKKSQSHK